MVMNIKNNIYGFFALGMVMTSLWLTSCAGDEEISSSLDASKDKIVSPSNITFGGNVSSSQIKIQASGLWNITGVPSWFSLSQIQGNGDATITLTTNEPKENPSAIDERTATLVLNTDVRQREILVKQLPAEEVLEVSVSSIDFGTTDNLEARFVVTNNSTWKIIETQDWYTISKTEGASNDIQQSEEVVLTVQPKYDDLDNSHTLTITSKNGLTRTIALSQKGIDSDINPTKTELAVGVTEGTTTLQLVGDASWSASVSSAWLTLDSYTGKGSVNLQLSYTANETSAPREATITFLVAGGRYTRTCKVTQSVAEFPSCAALTKEKVEKYGFTVSSSYSSAIPVTEYGIVYSLTHNPTIANDKKICTDGTNPFTLSVDNLPSGKTYFVRAYAKNGAGVGYSEEIEVVTGGVKPGQDDNPTPNL